VSGAGVLTSSPNRDNAVKLIEFLASDTAQKLYADVNFEYPVKPGIELHPILAAWGEPARSSLWTELVGNNHNHQIFLID